MPAPDPMNGGLVGTHELQRQMADRMIDRREVIARRWLLSLEQVVNVKLTSIFPTADPLDHIPEALAELAGVLRANDPAVALEDTAISHKAQQLGELRHRQDATVAQILNEYALLFDILMDEADDVIRTQESATEDAAHAIRLLTRAIGAMRNATVQAYVACHADTVRLQSERLRSLNGFLSHELRTPLQSAQLNLEIFRLAFAGNAEEGQQLDAVQTGLDRLVELLNGIDSLFHDSAQPASDMARQATDISAIVADVLDTLDEQLSVRGIRFETDDDLGRIKVDPAKLRLVLSNLINNAIKYSDPDKPVRRVEVRRAVAPTDDMLALRVSDNGLGIPEESQAEVFMLRHRAHAGRDEELDVSGHGYGLYLVAEAIADMNGQITLDSAAGRGCDFLICLPDGLSR